jgi:hypothetical protein
VAVGVEEIFVCKFEETFGEDEDELGRNIDECWLGVHGVEATLQNAEQFNFFELFLLSFPCLDLIDKFDARVLIDSVYFVHIRTNAVMFLRPHLH